MNGVLTSTTRLLEILSRYQPICTRDGGLCISSHLIRATDGTPLAAVGGERSISARDRIDLFADALVWKHHHWGNGAAMRFVLGVHPNMTPVRNALSTLCRLLEPQLTVQLEVDDELVKLSVPDFAAEDDPWTETLLNRGELLPPDLANELKRAVGPPSFRWYYTLKACRWSGRVEGLEVCRLAQDGKSGILTIGKPGRFWRYLQSSRTLH